jgi:membrane-associated phospholipid phosphatase
MMRSAAYTLVALACATAPIEARQPTDPGAAQELYDTGDWVLVGSLLAAQMALIPLDDDLRQIVVDLRGDGSDRAADVLRPLGATRELAVAGAATYVVGLATSNRRVADFGLHAIVSLALGNLVTGTLKVVAGRARPTELEGAHDWDSFGGWGDDGGRRSYPSGHSTNAFTIATVFAEELGGATPWVAYPLAAGVAWSRINDDEHWASDVVTGALIGIVAGQIVVRLGHEGDGWLERTLLLQPSRSVAAIDVGLQIAFPR